MLYGRVTVTEVEAIVKQTIIQGKVIQCVSLMASCFPNVADHVVVREMLRGGIGLSRSEGQTLLSW